MPTLSRDSDCNIFVVVIGLHSSGSSCLAGVLYHLGLHLGNRLVGHYGRDPNKNCGFEAAGLLKICRAAVVIPNTTVSNPRQLSLSLRQWISSRTKEAADLETIAAGKYPTLCQMGSELREICGPNLRVVNIDRKFEESAKSLSKRFPNIPDDQIEAHQRWLKDGKSQLLADLPSSQQITINFSDLLSSPRSEIERICNFLSIQPDHEKVDKAIAWVDPSKRHINLEN